MKRILEILKFFISPINCLSCGRLAEEYICERCEKLIEINDFPICLSCDGLSPNWQIHKACNGYGLISQCFIPFIYTSVTKELIIKSKHGPRAYSTIKSLFKLEWNQKVISGIKPFDIIVPAPSSNNLQNRRLINHAYYLAELFAIQTGAFCMDILTKSSKATSQKSLSKHERGTEINKSIKLKDGLDDLNFQGKKILIVDDVATTGSTLIQCTKELTKLNPSEISCYAIAKDLRYNIIGNKYENIQLF